ncbi:hypothetical protein KA005_18025 [bacterium]|nr:hypothetical protein [bacterium]
MTSYKVVWHKVFRYQYQNLRQGSLLKRQVAKQLEVIQKNPETAGAALKHLPSHLAGRIKRLKVGGPKRYRMIIMVHREEKIIEVCFVDPRLRGKLDYKTLPLEVFEMPEDEIDAKGLKKFILT